MDLRVAKRQTRDGNNKLLGGGSQAMQMLGKWYRESWYFPCVIFRLGARVSDSIDTLRIKYKQSQRPSEHQCNDLLLEY